MLGTKKSSCWADQQGGRVPRAWSDKLWPFKFICPIATLSLNCHTNHHNHHHLTNAVNSTWMWMNNYHQQPQTTFATVVFKWKLFKVYHISSSGRSLEWNLSGLSQSMITSSNGNILRVAGPLWGEFPSHRWIPLTKASNAELRCILWSAPEQTVQ